MGDFDFDDDMLDGFDDLPGENNEDDIGPPANKREVVERVLKKAAKTAGKDIKDVDKQIDTFLEKGLPSGLSPIKEGVESANYEIQSAYYDAVKQVKPKMGRIAKQLDKVVPDKLKPVKKLTSKLAANLSEESGYYSSKRDPLAEIAEKVKALIPDGATTELDAVKEQLEQNRHAQRSDLLAKIATYQQASFEVTRTREATYQRKHLELMYKSVYYSRETHDVIKNSFNTFKEQLEAVIKNTGLPEVLKIHKTERFSELLRDQYLRIGQSELFGSGEWFARGMKNLKAKITDTVTGISDVLDMAEGGIEGAADAAEMGDGGGIGDVVGSGIAGFISGRAYSGLSSRLSKNSKAKAIIKRLANTYKNAPEELEQFLATDRARKNPILRQAGYAALNLIRPAGGQFGIEVAESDLNGPAIFSGAALKSVTTVIPGYLGRILAQVTSIRTGSDPELVLYDFNKDKFKDKKALRKDIRKKFIYSAQNSGVGRNVDRLINDVIGDTEISPKQRALLKRRLLTTITDTSKGDTVSRLKATGVFEGLPKEVVKKFENVANNTEEDGLVVEDEIRRARSMLPRFKDELAKLINAGYGNLLLEEGIVVRRNGKWVMSIKKFRKFLNIPSSTDYPTMSKEAQDVTKAASAIIKSARTVKSKVAEKTKGVREEFVNIAGNYWDAISNSKLGKDIRGSKSIQELKSVFNRIKDPKEREAIIAKITDPKTRESLIRQVKDPEERSALIKKYKSKVTDSSSYKNTTTIAGNYWEAVTGSHLNTPTGEVYGPPRPPIETMGSVDNTVGMVEDASDEVQELTQMKPSDNRTLSKVIDKVGIDKLTTEGVIGKVRSGGSIFVNVSGLKSLASRLTGRGGSTTAPTVDSGTSMSIETAPITERFDTHLKYMEMLLSITTTISEQISGLGTGNKTDGASKFSKVRNKLTDIMGKPISVSKQLIGKIGSKASLLKSLPSRMLSGITGKIGGGLAAISGMVGPLINSLTAPLEMVKEISMSMLGYFGKKLTKLPKAAMTLLRAGAKGGKWFGRLLLGDSSKLVDLYTKSSAGSPVFKANAAKMGMYIDTGTGKTIEKLSDITGTVVDIDGNVAISNEDIIEGLYDASGNEVRVGTAMRKGVLRSTGGFIKRGVSKILNTIRKSSILKGLKKPFSSLPGSNVKYKSPDTKHIGEYLRDGTINAHMYAESITQTGLLMDIRSLVTTIVTDGKWNDKNADGFRDNSWRDQLKRVNRNKDKKTTNDKKTDKEDKKFLSGLLLKLLAMGGSIFTMAKGFGSDLLEKILGGAAAIEGARRFPRGGKGKTGGAGKVAKAAGMVEMVKHAGKFIYDHIPGKTLSKKIPGLGIIAGGAYAVDRAIDGDYKKAAAELASGAIGSMPWVGTAASLFIDNWFGLNDDDPSDAKNPDEPKSLGNNRRGRNRRGTRPTSVPILRTPMLPPDDGPMYLRIAPGVRMDNLHPEFKILFYSMVSEYGKLTGNTVQVNSAYRTIVPYNRCGTSRVNTTCSSRSMHAYGLAIDINSAEANHMEKLGLMRKYGITRPVGQEKWHLEPAGIQTDLSKARSDPAWAGEQIRKGVGKGGGGYATISSARKEGRDPILAKKLLTSVSETDTRTTVAAMIKKVDKQIPNNKTIVPSAPIKTSISPSTYGATNVKDTNKTRVVDNMPPTYAKETLKILEDSLMVQKTMSDNISDIKNIMLKKDKVVETPTTVTVTPKPQPTKIPEPSVRMSRR